MLFSTCLSSGLSLAARGESRRPRSASTEQRLAPWAQVGGGGPKREAIACHGGRAGGCDLAASSGGCVSSSIGTWQQAYVPRAIKS